MEVSLLNVRIIFQKNAVAVDGIGNHKNTWADHYSCRATVSGEAGKQTSETVVAGTVADESDISFTDGVKKPLLLIPQDTVFCLMAGFMTSSPLTT